MGRREGRRKRGRGEREEKRTVGLLRRRGRGKEKKGREKVEKESGGEVEVRIVGGLEVKEKKWARTGGGFSVLDKASEAKVLAKCFKF